MHFIFAIFFHSSWSQPGEAALRTSDHGDPERAAGPFTGRQVGGLGRGAWLDRPDRVPGEWAALSEAQRGAVLSAFLGD